MDVQNKFNKYLTFVFKNNICLIFYSNYMYAEAPYSEQLVKNMMMLLDYGKKKLRITMIILVIQKLKSRLGTQTIIYFLE